MRRGLTLAELMVVLAILAIVTAVTLPRLAGVRDWIAVDTAAHDVTAAITVARSAAISQGTRSRAMIAPDSLRIDRWQGDSWGELHRWPGPDGHGVALEVSNPVVVFDPIGLAFGLSNTTVVLATWNARRQAHHLPPRESEAVVVWCVQPFPGGGHQRERNRPGGGGEAWGRGREHETSDRTGRIRV